MWSDRHRRTVTHATEEPVLATHGSVVVLAGQGFEGISTGHMLGELGCFALMRARPAPRGFNGAAALSPKGEGPGRTVLMSG